MKKSNMHALICVKDLYAKKIMGAPRHHPDSSHTPEQPTGHSMLLGAVLARQSSCSRADQTLHDEWEIRDGHTQSELRVEQHARSGFAEFDGTGWDEW